MFEIGRELKRFFSSPPARDGLCRGDSSLLELLDLKLLAGEARAADVAVGRIGEKDRPTRLLEASAVWRELARRTGDPASLRKSASCAEHAARIWRQEGRARSLPGALCAQAEAALLGAELFAEAALNAAADFLVGKTPSGSTATAALAARIGARQALSNGGLEEVCAAARRYQRPLAELEGVARTAQAGASLRCDRAEFLTGAGVRLGDTQLLDQALEDLDKACLILNGDYHPLSAARAAELRGLALVRLGEIEADVGAILEGLDALTTAVDMVAPDHSPLDWARLQHSQGLALMALGEAGDSESAFDRALRALGRALPVLNAAPSLALRTVAAQDRAACLVRRAELKGDILALDEAEAILRSELAALRAPPDPVAWAVLQLNLARIYMAQASARGRDNGEGRRAGDALASALDVFGEHGLRSLSALANTALDKLRETAAAR